MNTVKEYSSKQKPAKNNPPLNIGAASLLTACPRSLRALICQLNQGETRRENLTWNEIQIQKPEGDEVKTNQVNTTMYVKSVSNLRVTLNMFATDWNPVEISDYLTISWDYNGTILNPGEIIPVTMTLSASPSDAFINYLVENEITRFDVVIHIVASD